MKKQLNYLLLPLCICLLFASCSEEFAAVEESESFDALTTYYDQMNEWNAIALNAVASEAFSQVNYTAASSDTDCEGTTTTTAATSSLTSSHVSTAMNLYVETLGFESPRALNRWFIDFGKHYYDLVIENRPEDKTAFINQVSDMQLVGANACVKGCMQRLSVNAYNFAKNFGVRTNTVDPRTQTHNEVYGVSSPSYYTFRMLADKSSCQGAE